MTSNENTDKIAELGRKIAALRTMIDNMAADLHRDDPPTSKMVAIHVPAAQPHQTEATGARGRKVNYEDKRLPPVGSLIVRKYEGKTYLVKVLGDGFEHAGHKWRSLSAVARHITGTQVNGFKWFGLE